MPRQTCHVHRYFNTIKAKRGTFNDFIPIGRATELPGEPGEILLIHINAPYSEYEILAAYNAAGYPPVRNCVKVTALEMDDILRMGYAGYMSAKIAGKIK